MTGLRSGGENYLDVLAAQRPERSAFWLLDAVYRNLEQHYSPAPSALPAVWQPWWDLLQFCLGVNPIAQWLRTAPDALQRIQALAALAGENALADHLAHALQGQALPAMAVTFSQLGEQDLHLPIGGLPQDWHDGQDWAASDAAIQLQLDGFARIVADLLLQERHALLLPAPAHRGLPRHSLPGLAQPHATTPAQQMQQSRAAFAALLQQPKALQVRTPGHGQRHRLPVTHRLQPGLSAELFEFYRVLLPQAAAPLLAVAQLHDGADLFVQCGPVSVAIVGLTLFPVGQWSARTAAMHSCLSNEAWPQGEPPCWWAQSIAFAQGGADDEHWLLVTTGPQAGGVTLSATDAPHGRVRFASTAAFFTALQHQPARVLAASGHLLYDCAGRPCEPV
ncbi:hypothetical protein AAV94_05485 [Lampropedia cohaerens]|uniref:Uncharacterized protein n=1 Tax=Lampropedia cohaerens TaxID=1610491 RepID=A0A0U1Q0I5_9BURK|nr:hypothetical protein [Lampropedia cohaerens]KKW68278.1 hypothetical protein AAV94_05485 [Lampropedia cohaerens]